MTDSSQHWLILVMSLSGRAGTPRMRIWRALRSLGAAVMRDGVYLLPANSLRKEALQQQADAVRELGGKALLLEVDESTMDTTELLLPLFDRTSDFQDLVGDVSEWQEECPGLEEREAQRRVIQLQRRFQAIVEVDFFPGLGRERAIAALAEAEAVYNRCFVPDEPQAIQADIPERDRSAFRGRAASSGDMCGGLPTAQAAIVQKTSNELTELLKSLPPSLSNYTATLGQYGEHAGVPSNPSRQLME